MDALVTFSEITTTSGHRIGHATLNHPKALNALGIDMIRLLMPQLLNWQRDPEVVCVVLDGAGDKAFCAGGDVVAMFKAMASQPQAMPDSLQAFFTEEYALDYLIHTFGKPFVVWGNGIIMGGGMGLMNGASHRIVTETARLAMPEITIGLYPDVGGSWFLNRMPDGCGLFLGLTGASINAADALYIDLADHFIPHEQQKSLFDAMSAVSWSNDVDTNHSLLSGLCQELQTQYGASIPQGNIRLHQDLITGVTHFDNVSQVVEAILQLDCADDKWLSRAQQALKSGSPITMHLVFEQLRRGKNKSLAEVFQMELGISCRCGELGEFQEGVRALLIDKDNQPQWRYDSVEAVDDALVESFFAPRWTMENHPLAALGK